MITNKINSIDLKITSFKKSKKKSIINLLILTILYYLLLEILYLLPILSCFNQKQK